MEFEAFSFTPNISGVTMVLDDTALIADFIYFQVSKNGSDVNKSTGFSDGVKNRAAFVLDDTVKESGRTTSYSIYHKKKNGAATAVALAGKPSANWNATAGEVEIDFSTVESGYTVDGYVIGHH